MSNISIKNTIPNVKIFNNIPNIRVSNFQVGRRGTPVKKGTPIGLLLALTYAEDIYPLYGDFRPNIRIKSQ